MKKNLNLILVIFVISALVLGTLPAFGNSADDYKVIKNAAKTSKGTADITWFRIEVTEKGTNKAKVKIKLPISVIEMLAECTDGDINLENKCKINLKKILAELKKGGPMTLVEIEEDDGYVKIWFE